MLLIIGYDPGKTFSLSLIDVISGKLLLVYSDKNKSINFVIKKIFQYGTPLCLGFDKKNLSSNLVNIARRLRIAIIHPETDLKITKKRNLIKSYFKEHRETIITLNNKHEMDSLASAIYAYKKIKPLINKLKNEINSEEKIKEVLFLLFKKKVKNIKEALQEYNSIFC